MSRIVRQSKFRHVFGTVAKKENCYDDLKPTRSAWDADFIAGNGLHFAVCWDSAGGGAVAVVPWSAKAGKIDPKLPLITGHSGAVLDIAFNPFNDSLLASVSEDCTGKIWGIPEGGLKENMIEPLQTLKGHKRKVGSCKFHPTANNILMTTSTDFSVKIWDIEKGTAPLSVDAQHADIIQSADWNENGTIIATTCKDKKIRVLDPRENKISQEVDGHQGVKGSRLVFIGNEKLFTVGFTKNSEREYAYWDSKNLSKPLVRVNIDSSSGVLMPFYDSDTKVLFLAGKGDGNIRYYEMVDEDPFIHYLTEFKSATPQRGIAMIPKRAVNVSECEIVKLLKLGTKTMEPISFQVPRKSEIFQDDIFPDTFSGEYSLTADEYLSNKNGELKKTSLAPGFVVKPKPTDFNPDKKEEEKPLSERELKDEVERLTNRVAYLEAEIVKKDAKIREMQ